MRRGECGNLRALLEGHGDSIAIDTAHEKTKQTSHGEELLEGCAVDGGDLQDAEDDHVEDHGPLATILVTSETEEGGADGAEEESQGDGGGDVGLGGVVVLGQLDSLDGEGVEVKGISGPGAEADDEEDPVLERELGHQTDGVLERVGIPPFSSLLTMLVVDDDALLPDEEVLEGLLGRGQDALGHGIGWGAVLNVVAHD